MLLAIDIGNTNSVFALYDGDDQRAVWRCQTVAGRTTDEYAAFLKQLFDVQGFEFNQVGGAIVSSVVPEANRQISVFCQQYLDTDAVFVTHDMVPVEIDLPSPRQVGADRLVNAVAVGQEYALPAVVIDFGTATTFDVISSTGAYSGGVIAPGIHLSIDALARATAKLPKVSVRRTDTVIGKSTEEAIQAGIFWGYIGLIEKITAQITLELGAAPTIIATGGLAPLFADHVETIDAVDGDLTLKGLLHIYKGLK